MFEVGKKYQYRDNANMIIEVLHVTNKNALVRMIEHLSASSIGNEHLYDHSVSRFWVEYKKPRTITRWVNVYERGDELYTFPDTRVYSSKEDAERGIQRYHSDVKYVTTTPFSYTEPH